MSFLSPLGSNSRTRKTTEKSIISGSVGMERFILEKNSQSMAKGVQNAITINDRSILAMSIHTAKNAKGKANPIYAPCVMQ